MKCCLQIFILFSFTTATSAVIFKDDFTVAGDSYTNWIAMFNNGNGIFSFSKGKAILDNKDYSYSGLALHTFSNTIENFTLSAVISSPYPNAGLYFCVSNSGPKITGYEIRTGGDQSITVVEHGSDSTELLFERTSAFIRNDTNRVTVSKLGRRFSVFCNGIYIGSFLNTSFGYGHIALAVPPASVATFDEVVMSDSVKDSIFSGVFHDSFTNVAGYGWSAGGSGVGEYENGIFSVRTEPRQYYYRYVDLLLKQFDLILVISRIAGPSGSSYGIFLREPLDDTSYSDRLFGIDAPGRYAICRADSLDKGIHGIVDSGILCSGECYDTLKLSGEKDRTIHFLINGDTVQTISKPEIIHGAGFFTGDSQHVHFDSFFLKAYSDSISSIVIRKSAGILKNPVFTKQSSGTIDILGRTLQMKDRELIEKSGNRNRIVIITKKGEGDHPQPFILLP